MQLDRKKLLKKELEVVQVDLGNEDFVFVKQMNGHERDLFDKSLTIEIRDEKGDLEKVERKLDAFRAKLVVATVCDEKGDLLLQPEDVELLNNSMGIRRLEKIADAAANLNKIGETARKDVIKNSEAAQSGSSNSSSVES